MVPNKNSFSLSLWDACMSHLYLDPLLWSIIPNKLSLFLVYIHSLGKRHDRRFIKDSRFWLAKTRVFWMHLWWAFFQRLVQVFLKAHKALENASDRYIHQLFLTKAIKKFDYNGPSLQAFENTSPCASRGTLVNFSCFQRLSCCLSRLGHSSECSLSVSNTGLV